MIGMHKSNVVMQWRKTSSGYYILGSRCRECHEKYFPKRFRCAKCGSNELEDHKFKGTGKIHAHSTIFFPPVELEKNVPYTIAMVKLDEGPKITAQLIECGSPKDGMKVESCIRKLYADGESGIIHYGIKFRPSENGQ
jgi:uncharacterized protein